MTNPSRIHPRLVPTTVPAWRRNRRDHLLAGDGGDELFAGTNVRDRQTLLVYRHVPAFLRKGLIEPVSSLLPQNESRFSLPGATSSPLTFLFRAPPLFLSPVTPHPAGRNVRAAYWKRSTANLAEHSRRTLSYCRSVR